MELKRIEEVLAMFSDEARPHILETAERLGATHVVVFENADAWSSRYGDRTALAVGPGCTYETPEDVEGKHLHDLPSQRQYPTCYAAVGKEDGACIP